MLDTPRDRHLRGGWRSAAQNSDRLRNMGSSGWNWGVTSGKGANRTSACSEIQEALAALHGTRETAPRQGKKDRRTTLGNNPRAAPRTLRSEGEQCL